MSAITNVYVKSSNDSTLVIESMGPIKYDINKYRRNEYEIVIDGKLIMAHDTVNIYDGLVDKIKVFERSGKAVVSVDLEYPSSYEVEQVKGIPEKLAVSFDWSYIRDILKDKVIVIDPGHGGKDKGYRGYINLLEKNIAIETARFLKNKLNAFGACSVLTREKDITLNLEERAKITSILEADLFVGIHTHWDKDKSIGGSMGTYSGEHSRSLCDLIIQELAKKLSLNNLGIYDEKNSASGILEGDSISQIPYVNISICTISNPVEEGWLRSPVFKDRAAQSIMNGIIKYLQKSAKRYTIY